MAVEVVATLPTAEGAGLTNAEAPRTIVGGRSRANILIFSCSRCLELDLSRKKEEEKMRSECTGIVVGSIDMDTAAMKGTAFEGGPLIIIVIIIEMIIIL